MTFELSLDKTTSKMAMIVVVLCASLGLVWLTISSFVINTLTDNRVIADRKLIAAAVNLFPNSSRLLGRLAEAEMLGDTGDLSEAQNHALRAIKLSPQDFGHRLTLASIYEMRGDHQSAEMSLMSALSLAPHYSQPHWQLGNLFVREGKIDEALSELHLASADLQLLPATLDLTWRVTGGSLDATYKVVGSDTKSRFKLAQFLAEQSSFEEAASVLTGIDRASLLASPESFVFLNTLIEHGKLVLARSTWLTLMDEANSLISNGSFERNVTKNFSQFDWIIGRSEYARIKIDTGTAHTGARALRMDFTGRDTTRLDKEIGQLLALHSGSRYKLECYAKAENFSPTEGPRLVVTDDRSSNWIASSDPVTSRSGEWQRLVCEFSVPENTAAAESAIYITIKRQLRLSFEEPTRGTIWFDDFSLKEVQAATR